MALGNVKMIYDGKTYNGTRKQILEALRYDLENHNLLVLKYHKNEIYFYLGEEEYIITKQQIQIHPVFNVYRIKETMILEALNKIPIEKYTDKQDFWLWRLS